MPIRTIRASGPAAMQLSSTLLQRARNAHPTRAVWDAADIQWSWARPRDSDAADRVYWLDDEGPVAGVIPSSWAHGTWQCDPVIVPDVSAPTPEELWESAVNHMLTLTDSPFDVPLREDDTTMVQLALAAGFVPGDGDTTNWMNASDRPAALPVPEGFRLVDRSHRAGHPHPLEQRNGARVAERLRECPLYSAELDISLETERGEAAAYALFWFDPETRAGLVEPVRVEDSFQRRGLAKVMLTHGLERLANAGAERIKVVHETEAAGALYSGVGFVPESTTTWFRSPDVERASS